jgi:hypothetical protein
MRRVAVVLLLLAHDALGRRARKVRNPPQGQREEVPEAAAATRLAERLDLETALRRVPARSWHSCAPMHQLMGSMRMSYLSSLGQG